MTQCYTTMFPKGFGILKVMQDFFHQQYGGAFTGVFAVTVILESQNSEALDFMVLAFHPAPNPQRQNQKRHFRRGTQLPVLRKKILRAGEGM